MIRTLLQIIGAVVALACILGAIGFIDFSLCVAPTGGCSTPSSVPRPVLTLANNT